MIRGGGKSCYRRIIRVFSILICKDLKEYESDKCHRVVAKMNKCIDEYSIFELFFKGCEWEMTSLIWWFSKSEEKWKMNFERRFDKCFEMEKKFDKLLDLMRVPFSMPIYQILNVGEKNSKRIFRILEFDKFPILIP